MFKDLLTEIEGKLQNQVNQLSKFYDYSDLSQKMYDLALEWYAKGLHAGREAERTCSQENNE